MVKINNHTFKIINVSSDITQGSLFAPLLFINDLENKLDGYNFLLFAHDLKLFHVMLSFENCRHIQISYKQIEEKKIALKKGVKNSEKRERDHIWTWKLNCNKNYLLEIWSTLKEFVRRTIVDLGNRDIISITVFGISSFRKRMQPYVKFLKVNF